MNAALPARPAHGVKLFSVKDEGILFDATGQRLFHLNAAATYIWAHLHDGQEPEAIVHAGAEALRLPPGTARQFVHDMLKTWRAIGLLQDGRPVHLPDRDEETLDDSSPAASEADFRVPLLPARQCYRFLDSQFSLGFSSTDLAGLAKPVFRHLAVPTSAVDALMLNVIETSEGIRVIHGGQIIGRCASAREVAPLLHGLVGLLAIRRCRYLFAVHGSVLARSGNVLILAGRSGCGKTTMAAGLVAAGWKYMSDDTALLLPQTLECAGVPYALTLKEGAWPLLRRYFPAIDRMPIHVRADGQAVRYLCPPSHDFATSRPVRWIGFPHHAIGSSSSMRPLEQIEGLCRVLEHCCAIPHLLQARDIEHLVRWSAGIRFFEFAIADLDEAIAQVDLMTGGCDEECAGRLPISDDSRQTAIGCTS